MALSEGIVRNSHIMLRLITFAPMERPIGIQITGSSESIIRSAVRKLTNEYRPTIIDINAGCPVPNICSIGCGAALLQDIRHFETIVRAAVKEAYPTPVSVKIRAGWTNSPWRIRDIVKALEAAGASFITVHARLRNHDYLVPAAWEWIGEAKDAVTIPIIGNGDILTPSDAQRMLASTGCDGIMIARGALGNPWIFSRTRSLLDTGVLAPEPTDKERFNIIIKHFWGCIDWLGEIHGVRLMRKHICWYTKDVNGANMLRNKLWKITEPQEICDLLEDFRDKLIAGDFIEDTPDKAIQELFKTRVAYWTASEPSQIEG